MGGHECGDDVPVAVGIGVVRVAASRGNAADQLLEAVSVAQTRRENSASTRSKCCACKNLLLSVLLCRCVVAVESRAIGGSRASGAVQSTLDHIGTPFGG